MNPKNFIPTIITYVFLSMQLLFAGNEYEPRNMTPYIMGTGLLGAFSDLCSHYYRPWMSYLTTHFADEPIQGDYDDSDVAQTSGVSDEEDFAFEDVLTREYIEQHIQNDEIREMAVNAVELLREIEASLCGVHFDEYDYDDSDIAQTSGVSENAQPLMHSESPHPFYDSWSQEDYAALTALWSEARIQRAVPQELFMNTVRAGNVEVLKAFLHDKRIDVNDADKNGVTPLICSISLDRLACVNLLLEHEDIDVNDVTAKGNTALMYTTQKEDPAYIQRLLCHQDIDVNIRNNAGRTPLENSVLQNNPSLIEALINHKGINKNEILNRFLSEEKKLEGKKIFSTKKSLYILQNRGRRRGGFFGLRGNHPPSTIPPDR